MSETEQTWARLAANAETVLDDANTALDTARREARHYDPFAPDAADIQEMAAEKVNALRDHRDRVARDLRSTLRQRDRALGVKR